MDFIVNGKVISKIPITYKNTLGDVKTMLGKWEPKYLEKYNISIIFNNGEKLDEIVFKNNNYDKINFSAQRNYLIGGKIIIEDKERDKERHKERHKEDDYIFALERLPKPALQQVLYSLKRKDLNKLCNLSKTVKYICDLPLFRENYNKINRTYTEAEIIENLDGWISEYMGDMEVGTVITLYDLFQILKIIEQKTNGNDDRIIFAKCGRSEFTTKTGIKRSTKQFGEFLAKANRLQVGFIANSKFAGILGSIIAASLLNRNNPASAYDLRDLIKEQYTINTNIRDLLLNLYLSCAEKSLMYRLDDTYTSEGKVWTKDFSNRIQSKIFTNTLEGVEICNLEKLENMLH